MAYAKWPVPCTIKYMKHTPKNSKKICTAIALIFTVNLMMPTSGAHGTKNDRAAETSTTVQTDPGSAYTSPPLPQKSGSGRRVVYGNSLQWVWVVDAAGNVVRAMPVSGQSGVPLPGTYAVKSQSLRSTSTDVKGVWFKHMTRFALGPQKGNIGFHEIPVKNGKPLQTEEQLGTFQSGGCVRMSAKDAKFIYTFAKIGTKVVVLP